VTRVGADVGGTFTDVVVTAVVTTEGFRDALNEKVSA
jgi:hypothetical protein